MSDGSSISELFSAAQFSVYCLSDCFNVILVVSPPSCCLYCQILHGGRIWNPGVPTGGHKGNSNSATVLQLYMGTVHLPSS